MYEAEGEGGERADRSHTRLSASLTVSNPISGTVIRE